jgi:hypothetical protein
LEKIAIPTLVISAEDDLFGTFKGGRCTAEHIPGTHFVCYIQPETISCLGMEATSGESWGFLSPWKSPMTFHFDWVFYYVSAMERAIHFYREVLVFQLAALRASCPGVANRKRKVVISPVAVEKLFPAKFAKIKLRQDALWAIFSNRKTFSITQILVIWGERRVFQHPRLISSIITCDRELDLCTRGCSTGNFESQLADARDLTAAYRGVLFRKGKALAWWIYEIALTAGT